MPAKLFVGGLAWATTEESLKNHFSQVGSVVSATVINDKFTGRSRGFGFVEMSTDQETAEAIAKLNESELDGRKIIVNEAKPRTEGESRPRGNFSRGGGDRPRGGGFGGGNRDRNRGGYR